MVNTYFSGNTYTASSLPLLARTTSRADDSSGIPKMFPSLSLPNQYVLTNPEVIAIFPVGETKTMVVYGITDVLRNSDTLNFIYRALLMVKTYTVRVGTDVTLEITVVVR
jgi:hypothetical protein